MKRNKVGHIIFSGCPKNVEEEIKKDLFTKPILENKLKTEFLYIDFFSIFFKENKIEFYYNNRKLNLDEYKFFILRPKTGRVDYNRLSIVNFLEKAGKKVFNSYESVILAKNKRESLIKLASLGLSVVPTGINYSQYFLDSHLKRNNKNKLIAKLNSSSLGQFVSIFESHMSFISFMEFVADRFFPENILIQPFINSNAEDHRVFVVGNKVVAAMKRKGQGIDFRSNLSRGGGGQKIEVTKKMKDLAIRSTKILGLDYAGVDIIKDKNGKLMILEVNSTPAYKIQEITGVDVASEIVKHCIKKTKS